MITFTTLRTKKEKRPSGATFFGKFTIAYRPRDAGYFSDRYLDPEAMYEYDLFAVIHKGQINN